MDDRLQSDTGEMKKIVLLLFVLTLGALSSRAAENTDTIVSFRQDNVDKPQYRNVYVELWGASNLIGVSYDSRFRRGSRWGYRAGLSFTAATAGHNIWDNGVVVGVPLEVNGIFGRGKSKFEAGVGFNLGFITGDVKTYTSIEDRGDGYYKWNYTRKRETDFYYFGYFNIGYRYQRPSGFMLRVGINPGFNFGGDIIKRTPWIYPYISFGYTIK